MLTALNGLRKRAVLVSALREFFSGRAYLEVETPIRIPAPLPEAHIEPVASEDWFLQTSPESCMKRLLAAGLPKIFQICKCFRKGERGERHLPEFTILEWYAAGSDYRDLMRECEELFRHLAGAMGLGDTLAWQGRTVNLAGEWERLTVAEAFARHAPCSLAEAMANDRFDEVLVGHVEPHLGMGSPIFLCDYPAALAALARRKPTDPQVAERFELYLAGLELANGFSELIDPAEQLARFIAEQEKILALGRKPGPTPERFLAELGLMPPAAGIALGVDRLAMLFTGAAGIEKVVSFPPERL